MKLSLFLGIFAFVMVGMLSLTTISAFMQGQLFLGLIRLGLLISSVFIGYIDLKDWKEGK